MTSRGPAKRGFPRISLDAGLSLQVRSTGTGGWILGLLNLSFFGSVDGNQKGPRVVLVNRFGREHVIEQYTSVRKASHDRARVKGGHCREGLLLLGRSCGDSPSFRHHAAGLKRRQQPGDLRHSESKSGWVIGIVRR